MLDEYLCDKKARLQKMQPGKIIQFGFFINQTQYRF